MYCAGESRRICVCREEILWLWCDCVKYTGTCLTTEDPGKMRAFVVSWLTLNLNFLHGRSSAWLITGTYCTKMRKGIVYSIAFSSEYISSIYDLLHNQVSGSGKAMSLTACRVNHFHNFLRAKFLLSLLCPTITSQELFLLI